MGFRTLVITDKCRLDYRMNFMRRRTSAGIDRVFLEEVDTIIIESTAVTITAFLLQELLKRKISVIFCDTTHNPLGELRPLAGSHDAARRLRAQIAWDADHCLNVWRAIVGHKLFGQASLLARCELDDASSQVLEIQHELNLALNMDFEAIALIEARAARRYFAAIFGSGFMRRDREELANQCLNYAYSVILSSVNRAIVASGYSTLLGIFHHGPENSFNFGSDLIEPLRPVVDEWVLANDFGDFNTETKHRLVNILNQRVQIDGTTQHLNNAIEIYIRSVLRVLEDNTKDPNAIKFCSFTL